MAEMEKKPAVEPKIAVPPSAVEVVVASATEAFWSAFILSILGGVAISIAGGFAGDMAPSLPPGFGGGQGSEGRHGGHHGDWWNGARNNVFVLFFAVFFFHSLWKGFHGGKGAVGGRIGDILSKLRENWFSLIVGNAIGAWIAVLVSGIALNFALTQILRHAVGDMILPSIREVGRFIFGEAAVARMGDWSSWYNGNQTKINFWIIYFAGAIDDLGVPNFKTLARWGWRRYRKRTALRQIDPKPD